MLYFENASRPQNLSRADDNSGISSAYHPKENRDPSYLNYNAPSYLQNPNSFPSNMPSFDQNPSVYKEPTLDYFNDANKKPEKPQEEYFPFGRPGGGAPYRDEHGQIISKRPGNQFTSSNDRVSAASNMNASKPNANWTNDQQKNMRDQQKEEWRKSLLEQVQEKDRIKQAQRDKIALEERRAEEKIASELKELEERYKKEIRGEQGLPPEPDSETRAPPKKFERKGRATVQDKKKEESREVYRESPKPLVKELNPIGQQKPYAKYSEFNPMKIEYWKAQSDLSVQHNSFNDILSKLRYDADQAHLERNDAMLELERYRETIRTKLVEDSLQTQHKQLFSNNYSYSHIENSRSLKMPHSRERRELGGLRNLEESQSRGRNDTGNFRSVVLNGESRFVPLVSAGNSVVSTGSLNLSKNDYDTIDDAEIKKQLAELDMLLQQNS